MDFIEVLKEHEVEYREYGEHHHVTPGRINIDCPDCSPNSGRFRLGWHLRNKYFSCWSCGKKPSLDCFIELFNLSKYDALQLLKKIDVGEEPEIPVRKGRLILPPFLGPLLKPHRDYLLQRGDKCGDSIRFNPDRIEREWGIKGLDHRNPIIPWHIFIPIHADGDIISWTSRAIGAVKKRYLAAEVHQEKISKNSTLYGLDKCKNTIIVHEGPFDVWATGPGSAALMGLNYTRAQVLAIARFPVRYICLDNAPESKPVAKRLAAEVDTIKKGKTHVITLDAKDAASASRKELKRLRRLLQ